MNEKNLEDYIYYSLIIAIIILVILSASYNYIFSSMPFAPCYIYENFGLYCPGCGCTRAFIALLNLDILGSIFYNPAVLYSVIVLFIYLITQTVDRIFKHQNYVMSYSNIYLYIGIGILILNCIMKNILTIFFNFNF